MKLWIYSKAIPFEISKSFHYHWPLSSIINVHQFCTSIKFWYFLNKGTKYQFLFCYLLFDQKCFLLNKFDKFKFFNLFVFYKFINFFTKFKEEYYFQDTQYIHNFISFHHLSKSSTNEHRSDRVFTEQLYNSHFMFH